MDIVENGEDSLFWGVSEGRREEEIIGGEAFEEVDLSLEGDLDRSVMVVSSCGSRNPWPSSSEEFWSNSCIAVWKILWTREAWSLGFLKPNFTGMVAGVWPTVGYDCAKEVLFARI